MKSSNVKSWIRYILIITGTVFVLSLLLFAVALMVLDDDDYRKLAVWGVEHLTGYRMIVEGAFSVHLSAEPSLTVGGIRFEALAGDPSPPLTSIGHLHLKMALKPLVWGNAVFKQLRLEDVSIDRLNLRGENRTQSWLDSLVPDYFIPVFENVTLKNIKTSVADRILNRELRFHLNRFVLNDLQDSGPLLVKGDGLIEETGFQIQGRLGALADIFNAKQPYPLDISLKLSGLILAVSGTIANYADGEGMNFEVTGEEQDLAELLKTFKLNAPPLGRLKFKTTLSGDVAAPRLSKLALVISDDSSLEFTAKGSVANLADGEGTDISLSGLCTNEAILKLIFPENWQIVEKFKFSSALHHKHSGFWIENIDAHLFNDRGVSMEAEGRLLLGGLNNNLPVKEVDLSLHLVSTRTEAIRPLLTNALPEIGSVDAKGRLVGQLDRLALEDLVIIRGGSGPVWIETRGRIGWIPLAKDKPLAEIDLTFSGRAEQSKILSIFYEVPLDEIGAVAITGRVTGATNRFQLKEIEFHSRDAQGLETKMSGGIDFVEQADGKFLGYVNFKLQITAPNMGTSEPLLGARLVPGLGPVHAESLVSGTTELLSFENITITAGKPENVQIKWQGRVGKFPLGGTLPISDVQTYGSLQAVKSSDFAALFGISVADIGPVQASWREIDREGVIGVDNVKFIAGDGKLFRLSATGRVDSVIRHNEFFFDGLDLQLTIRAADTDNLFKLLGMQFPNLGAVDGRLALSGGEDHLTAEGLRLTVKSSQGLDIVAMGGVGYIGLEKAMPIRDIDVRLTAQAPDVAVLPVVGNLSLSDLGEFQASAKIRDRNGAINIEAFDLQTGSGDSTAFQMSGHVYHIRSRERMNLAADFRVDSRPWLESLLQRTVSENPKFNGSFKLTNTAADHIRIDAFEMRTAELGGLVLLAEGTVKPVSDSPELDIDMVSVTKDPAAWGTIFGMALPQLSSLTVNGNYSGERQLHSFKGESRLGNTRFQTAVRRTFENPGSFTDIKLSSKVVYLQDFGLYPEEPKNKSVSPSKTDPLTSGPLFDDQPLPLDDLKSNDFRLDFRADQVKAQNVILHRLGFSAELKNGRLRIDPFEVGYREGHMSLKSVFDTTGSEPTATLKILAEDVDIDDVLSYLHEPLVAEQSIDN